MRNNIRARIVLLGVLLGTLLNTACNKQQSELSVALSELDSAIGMRQEFIELKEERIAFLRSAVRAGSLTYQQRMDIIEQLVGEYDKYQLDSTILWLQRGVEIANKNNKHKDAEALLLRTSALYSAAGFYNEAYTILESIDTLDMTPAEKRVYYRTAHSYHREMREYSAAADIKEQSAAKEAYYIDRLIATEPDSLERRKLTLVKYGNLSDWEGMESELEHILPTLSPDSQEFAFYSYYKAISVGDDRGTPEEYMTHLARSARADMKSLTTDHASISMLAEVLFHKDDIERAFRYIQISMQDATFYNSRLRPWQVASIMPIIERSYSERMLSQRTAILWATIVISLLSVALFIILLQKSRQNRQVREAKSQLEEMNRRLAEYVARLSEQNAIEHSLSAELSEANAVKEQYIGQFLVICSNYIDLLKSYHTSVRKRVLQGNFETLSNELEHSTIVKDAEEEFYTSFDNAFLTLYPSFVEEFNALLKEEEQISLKKPRVLNTELRIFALIKLGITDSSRIAALLRHSVNTIYNYRAGVKNRARISRDDFEENVRHIGSKTR